MPVPKQDDLGNAGGLSFKAALGTDWRGPREQVDHWHGLAHLPRVGGMIGPLFTLRTTCDSCAK